MKTAVLSLCLFAVPSCWASVVIQFSEQPDGVHADLSGSLDLTTLSYYFTGNVGVYTYIAPQAKYFEIGQGAASYAAYKLPAGTVQVYGSNSSITPGTWVSGYFGLGFNGSFGDLLYIPPSYVSGTALTASAIFPGTFATYGFPSSDVVDSLPGGQTITFRYSSVPEPATFPLAAAALAVLAAIYRRRATVWRGR